MHFHESRNVTKDVEASHMFTLMRTFMWVWSHPHTSLTAWHILWTNLHTHPYKIHFSCLCVPRKTDEVCRTWKSLAAEPSPPGTQAYFHLTAGSFWDTRQPPCMSRKPWCGGHFISDYWQHWRELHRNARPQSQKWDENDSKHKMELDLSRTPSSNSAKDLSFPTENPMWILLAAMQSEFKSTWLLKLAITDWITLKYTDHLTAPSQDLNEVDIQFHHVIPRSQYPPKTTLGKIKLMRPEHNARSRERQPIQVCTSFTGQCEQAWLITISTKE